MNGETRREREEGTFEGGLPYLLAGRIELMHPGALIVIDSDIEPIASQRRRFAQRIEQLQRARVVRDLRRKKKRLRQERLLRAWKRQKQRTLQEKYQVN